jgi:hypothetical protein
MADIGTLKETKKVIGRGVDPYAFCLNERLPLLKLQPVPTIIVAEKIAEMPKAEQIESYEDIETLDSKQIKLGAVARRNIQKRETHFKQLLDSYRATQVELSEIDI